MKGVFLDLLNGARPKDLKNKKWAPEKLRLILIIKSARPKVKKWDCLFFKVDVESVIRKVNHYNAKISFQNHLLSSTPPP